MEMLTVPSIIILIIFSIILNRFIEMESRIFISNINSIRAAYNLEIALLSLSRDTSPITSSIPGRDGSGISIRMSRSSTTGTIRPSSAPTPIMKETYYR
jgi:hypothetical protein